MHPQQEHKYKTDVTGNDPIEESVEFRIQKGGENIHIIENFLERSLIQSPLTKYLSAAFAMSLPSKAFAEEVLRTVAYEGTPFDPFSYDFSNVALFGALIIYIRTSKSVWFMKW